MEGLNQVWKGITQPFEALLPANFSETKSSVPQGSEGQAVGGPEDTLPSPWTKLKDKEDRTVCLCACVHTRMYFVYIGSSPCGSQAWCLSHHTSVVSVL